MMLPKVKCIHALTFVIPMLLLDQYVLSSSARLNIERGDQDTFDNPNCTTLAGIGCSCSGSNADCVNSTSCVRCKCSSPYKTFLSSNDTNGRCVKDRRLLFIPANTSFLVKNTDCIRPAYHVEKTVCDENDSWQRWIWTQYNQLMHVDTLKCLQEGNFFGKANVSGNVYHLLVLGECNSAETKQRWKCVGQNNANFQSKRLKLYLCMYDHWTIIYAIDNEHYIKSRMNWTRLPSNENLCSEAFGCYEFVKDSAILVTDVKKCNQQCLEEREISVPHKSGENLCFVMWETLHYLDNNEWKQLSFRDEIFNIDKRDRKTFLKLNFRKATNNWTGLIVKLNFYCAEWKSNQSNIKAKDIKCVVIKFKENVIYSTTVPSTETNLITSSSTSATTTTDAMSNEKYKSDSSPVVAAIVVPVVIAILILCGILGFIYYKRRRRSESSLRAEPLVNFRTPAMSDNWNGGL